MRECHLKDNRDLSERSRFIVSLIVDKINAPNGKKKDRQSFASEQSGIFGIQTTNLCLYLPYDRGECLRAG